MLPSLHLRSELLRLVIPVGSMMLIACDATGPGTLRPVSLSVMTKPAGVSADVIVGTGPNSIRITKVEFVLAETELSQAGTCSSPPANDDDCNELELDPLLVDLPLDVSPPNKVLDALVPPGNYTRLEAELHAVESDEGEEGAAAFLAAHPEWSGMSVRVTGVYTDASGTPHDFTFTSGVDAEIEMAFSSPVTVDATTQNLTIVVDVASWFTDAAGAAIDPTNSANADAIGANIRSSFQAFEDNDHDGVDDEEEGESEDTPGR